VPTDVIMPALGMSQETGKLLRWLVAQGQPVTQGQPLMEIETDKVTLEIEAPASGVLAGVRALAGEEVPVGQVVAVILAPGETPPASSRVAPAAAPAARVHQTLGPPGPQTGRAPASPKARRLAQELGVDLRIVPGSGPGGEITAADVMNAKGTPAPPVGRADAVGNAWRVMADRVTRSWTSAPHFYLTREVSAARLVARRGQLQPQIPSITYTDLVILQAARALRQHPRLNARWENGQIVTSDQIGIGVAVATDAGLIVPVLTRADELSLPEIARTRFDLVTRAQAGHLRPEDVSGGTFTISNLGMYGVDAFYPILNPPQAAILAVGRIADRVVAVDGVAAVQPMLTLTLSCDHRVADGARGAQFLETLAHLIETVEDATL
jgi:pyruvate dehydrogenase E2 component (dihydrolipoamide acetyltransferase)